MGKIARSRIFNILYYKLRFFDFFKKKDSEDDKIALTFIDRLGKVKAISPYDIKVIVSEHGEAGKLTKFIVTFDDLVLIVKQADFSKPYPDNKRYRYNISVECSGDYEKVKCREKYERDLFSSNCFFQEPK